MAYVLAAGILAAVILAVGLLQLFFKSRPPSGDYVTPNVLTRIKTEYRDSQYIQG